MVMLIYLPPETCFLSRKFASTKHLGLWSVQIEKTDIKHIVSRFILLLRFLIVHFDYLETVSNL